MDDTTLDAIEGQARFSALTGDGVAPARSVIALVAEVRRLTAEAATQREWFEAADAAAERRLDQSIAWMERAEAAEAEVVTLRARLAAVESLADEWADRKRSDGMSGNAWIGLTLSGVAADLRVALGDEPTIVGSPPAAMVADYLAGKHGPPRPEVDALMAEDAALAGTTGEGE